LGIRETINRNSAVSTTVVACAIILCVVMIGLELRGANGKPPTKNYYSADDGKTWFVDSVTELPPFDHDGLQAVRCYVFKSKSGKFAGLLEKYSDDTLRQLAHMPAGAGGEIPVLVKKPGQKEWKSMGGEQEAMILLHISGPDGSDVERVMP
jgi:hypothetical protein